MSITLTEALDRISRNAYRNVHKQPTLDTFLEEVAELILSVRGKHEHPPELELEELGGIAANLLSRWAGMEMQARHD